MVEYSFSRNLPEAMLMGTGEESSADTVEYAAALNLSAARVYLAITCMMTMRAKTKIKNRVNFRTFIYYHI